MAETKVPPKISVKARWGKVLQKVGEMGDEERKSYGMSPKKQTPTKLAARVSKLKKREITLLEQGTHPHILTIFPI